MEKSLSPLAKEILSAGQYWVESTPPYWYIINSCLGIVIILSTIYLLFSAFSSRPASRSNVVSMMFAVFVLYQSATNLSLNERPNISVNYQSAVERLVQSDNINYADCVFGNSNYKIAKQLGGLEVYARAKATAIEKEATQPLDGKKTCGLLLEYEEQIIPDIKAGAKGESPLKQYEY
ncbi:TPA: hypothetical protein WI014_001293 [Neisseria meningitidis]